MGIFFIFISYSILNRLLLLEKLCISNYIAEDLSMTMEIDEYKSMYIV